VPPHPKELIQKFLANTRAGQKLAADSNPRRFAPLILVVVIILGAGIYFLVQTAAGTSGTTYSGTVEATEIHLAAEHSGRVSRVNVNEGEKVQTGDVLVTIDVGSGATREAVRSPIDGVVLERLVEPGEVTSPGTTLIILTNLDDLTLTVYVPEDRYGQIYLGQAYPVTVDSFPNESFSGTVRHIADQAEFTPRNVQTIDSRKSTVFAIRLSLGGTNGKLKPGMPADVHFQAGK
jgi:multidrug resistance efflux pump